MAIEKLTENVEIVQTLSDYPNQEDGLSAEDLKAKFDQGPKVIKDYINNVLVPAVNNAEQNIELFPVDVVRYRAPQMLTENEKAQVRENIGAAAAGADGSIVADAVLYTEQPLPLPQRAQARKNISAGLVSDVYYYTEREELDANYPPDAENGYNALHEHINKLGADYVYSLYDALDDKYVQKKDLKDNEGNVVLQEYIIKCNTVGGYTSYDDFKADDPARKPKYLIVTGIHGTERNAVFSAYRFVRDIINGHNVPRAFRDGAVLHVIPVANPKAFNAFKYNDGISVDKNFDWEWDKSDPRYDEVVWGKSAASKPETQAITKWLHENSDAVAFINYHNNALNNEAVVIVAPEDDEVDRVKRAAMRGVDHVIPYWRDVIGYTEVKCTNGKKIQNPNWVDGSSVAQFVFETKPRKVTYSYTVAGVTPASSVGYAINKVGIPSIFMETAKNCDDFDKWWSYDAKGEDDAGYEIPTYQPEAIAMGAEALGNILIELYSEASEVKDMAGVNDKLDTLIEDDMVEVQNKLDTLIEEDMTEVQNKLDALMGQINSGFHAVRGVHNIRSGGIVAEDKDGTKLPNATIAHPYRDIPTGAKLVIIQADASTQEAIKNKDTKFTLSIVAEFVTDTVNSEWGEKILADIACKVTYWDGPESNPDLKTKQEALTALWGSDAFTSESYALHEGAYNWTAYYWTEGEAIPAWTGGDY